MMLGLSVIIAFVGYVAQAAREPCGPGCPGWGPPNDLPSNYSGSPKVTIKNGTLVGMHSTTYKEDVFLGIPYAQPPTDQLRFRLPQSLNTPFKSRTPAMDNLVSKPYILM